MKSQLMVLALIQTLLLPGLAHAEPAVPPDAPIQTAGSQAADDIKATIIIDNPNALKALKTAKAVEEKEDERAESSAASPPLATDDTGTPGPGNVEVNFITECDHARGSRECEAGIDANLGIGEKVQLRVEKSVTHTKEAGQPGVVGHTATDIGVKWRFYDKNGLSMAFYPSYALNDASRVTNEEGEKEPGEGRSVYLPLIVSKDIGQKTTVTANVGYRKNLDNPDGNSTFTSLAIGRSLNDTNRIMGEVASEKFKNYRESDVRVGWVKVWLPNKTKNYEISTFTSIGHSIGRTEDGKGHTTVMFGIGVVRNRHK